ncbi:MAG TPA: hypothetical protein VN181_15285 [Thermoanaerobaculia bacterium]|nr:hypothetical protein [Thermoanaerobaculia bacterium]
MAEDLTLEQLVPLFVPTSFVEAGNWPGPYQLLSAAGVALTWSVLRPEQTMRYVDHGLAAFWESRSIEWPRMALENLLELARTSPWTHEFRRNSGEIYAVGMLHDDGIGPSRLLNRDRLESLFPEGYRVTLPEMSAALACRTTLDSGEIETLEAWSAECFEGGSRPLARGFFQPEAILPSVYAA